MGGQRLLVFLPGLVLKFARGGQTALLRRETANARAASGDPFWSGLAVTSLPIGSHAAASRRHGAVRPGDFPEAAALVEGLLDAAAGVARAPARFSSGAPSAMRDLPATLARRVRTALNRLTLPATGMHGDVHLYNFCRLRDGRLGLVDWEDYAPEASVVYDYVDFHVSSDYLRTERSGMPAFVAGLDGPAPAALRAAARFDLEPHALWLYYLVLKIGVMTERRGGLAALPAVVSDGLLSRVETHLVAAERAARPARYAEHATVRGERRSVSAARR